MLGARRSPVLSGAGSTTACPWRLLFESSPTTREKAVRSRGWTRLATHALLRRELGLQTLSGAVLAEIGMTDNDATTLINSILGASSLLLQRHNYAI